MKFWLSLASLLFACAWCAPAASAQEEISCDGPLQGDELRYPNARVAQRTLYDIAAVPASIVGWDEADWVRTGAFMLPTLTLMAPSNPSSMDVRLQRWLKRHENPKLERAFVKIRTIPEGLTLAGYGAVLFTTAWLTKSDRLFEYGTLALEALAISQFYHVTTKLLVGRESPYQGDGEGRIDGPTKFHFPGGTPSGHASTAYAMFAVLTEYWDKVPLYVLAHAAGLYISMSLVYERQHFLSDVIWGAGMGYYIGRWIVRHRSSRYRCRTKGTPTAWYERVMWIPMLTSHGIGLGASYRY